MLTIFICIYYFYLVILPILIVIIFRNLSIRDFLEIYFLSLFFPIIIVASIIFIIYSIFFILFLENIIKILCCNYYYPDNIFIQNLLIKLDYFNHIKLKNNNLFFNLTCIRGKIKTARWLLKNEKFYFNELHIKSLINTCCYYNNLDMIKLLYSTGLYNLEENNHDAIKTAIYKNHKDIIKWILKNNSKYKIINNKQTLFILDSNIKLAKYYLSINKKIKALHILNINDKINIKNNIYCRICLNPFNYGIQLECGHQFCLLCPINFCIFNEIDTFDCFYCRKKVIFSKCKYLEKN